MATNLYETLELDRDASPEQIRKAYKRKALATHPDRFATASAAEKSLAEEQFRKVNNAYEVLNNPENRQVYDQYGIWPPPERFEPPRHSWRHTSRHHRHQDPFPEFNSHFRGAPHGGSFGGMHSHHPFTDPFELFNSLFGDFHRHMSEPFMHFSHGHHGGFDDPREQVPGHHEPFDRFDMPGHGPGPMFGFPPSGVMSAFGGMPTGRFRMESHGFGPSNGRLWRQESRVTTTVNGVTQSTWTRVDSDGNKHETHTFPDGREVYRINGVEQLQNHDIEERFIPPPPPEMRTDGYPPPPLITSPHDPRSSRRSHSHEVPYSSTSVHPDQDWERDRDRERERDHGYGGERGSKKRWWHAGRH